MRQHLTLFANFICKFGDLDLVDLLQEVVLPAFTDDVMVREAYGSTFHLLDVEIFQTLTPGETEPAIAGQFVRDMVLRRSQVYDPATGALIEDNAELDTSPSSFFVLLLRDHRLIYFGETLHAPDLQTFAATMDRFLLRKYNEYIDRSYLYNKNAGNKITKKSMREEIPPPVLTIVPITNAEELEEFVARYKKLQRVDITVHRKNQEISTSNLIANAEAFNELLHGRQTKISTIDSGGLDKAGTIKALKEATDGANETIKLSGIDADGAKLVGDNDEFSVKIVLDHVAGTARAKAVQLYGKLCDLVGKGVIRRPAVATERMAAISQIVSNNDDEE